MKSQNVQDLSEFIAGKKRGTELDIATSQYADVTTKPGYRFDFHSTAAAVRSLIKSGKISADYGWRYYRVTVL